MLHKTKAASLELIAQANNKLTGDELLQQAKIEEEKERRKFDEQAGRYFSRKERYKLRKMQRENDSPNAALRGDSGFIAGVTLESTVMQQT